VVDGRLKSADRNTLVVVSPFLVMLDPHPGTPQITDVLTKERS
jgi:hypothetical protein